MTILPYDKYFSRWQRARARSQSLMQDFKSWCADGNARLPESWSPDRLQAGFAEILAEAEKVADEHRKTREDS